MAGYRGVGGGDRFYPDALTAEPVAPVADQAFQNMVWVDVHVNPQLANPDEKIQVHLKWIDMDDPFHHGDVVDPNDGIYYKAETVEDNRTAAALVGLDTATTHPKLGGVRKLVVETAPQGNASVIFRAGQQPGDNYRIVATGRNLELDMWKPFTANDWGELFKDLNGDNSQDENEPLLVGRDEDPRPTVATGGARATAVLTIWRYLQYELDSMGPIQGNWVQGTTGQVTWQPPVVGQWKVVLNVDPFSPQDIGSDSLNRFENGQLFIPSIGATFDVVSSDANSVVVWNDPQHGAPPENVAFTFVDDDDPNIELEPNVPEPDTGLLNLFETVFITPVPLSPNPRNNIASAVNVSDDPQDTTFQELVAQQKDFPTSRQHWTAYVMGAFQGPEDKDHDPHTENDQHALVGLTRSANGSMVFLEVARDRALTGDLSGPDQGVPWDAVMFEQQTLVHEMGHQFDRLIAWEDVEGIMRGYHGPDPGPEVEGLSGDPADNHFSEEAQKRIRDSTTVNE